jgi:glycosyltransferase involved in cell wall biosynthesis
MRKVAVVFNTNQLGGAERSIVEQLNLVSKEVNFTFFIPKLPLSDSNLVNFLKSKDMTSIEYFSYPGFLYKISRKNLHFALFQLILFPLLVFYLFSWHQKFNRFSFFYVNGNKASFPVLAWALLFRRRLTLIWHFRDFPSPKAFRIIGHLVGSFILSDKRIEIKLIANSRAVEKELKKYFPKAPLECLYNLPGNIPVKSSGAIKHIGIASMFAPWKGLHSVLLMIGLYEEELKQMGIEKISFYGDEIYQTSGNHLNYSKQLKKIATKFKVSLVEWPGKKIPEEIFAEIDVLIHPSLDPEPFGRVIIESFKAGVPVISTCLGGSAELIQNKVTGLSWEIHDYHSLYHLLNYLQKNPNAVKEMIKASRESVVRIETGIRNQVIKLFS